MRARASLTQAGTGPRATDARPSPGALPSDPGYCTDALKLSARCDAAFPDPFW